jgi:hypothetical protein
LSNRLQANSETAEDDAPGCEMSKIFSRGMN